MSSDPFSLSSAARSPQLAEGTRRTSAECVGRFVRLFAELESAKSWYEPRSGLLFAAALAVASESEPDEVAGAVLEAKRGLAQGAHWWQSAWQNRWLLAAFCAEDGHEPAALLDRIDAVRQAFKNHRLKRAGAYPLVAAALLRGSDVDGEVERLAAIHRGLKRRRRFVTGMDDYPGCALLARHDGSADELLERVIRSRDALAAAGFSDGNHLQRAALLHAGGDGDEAGAARSADVGAGLLHQGVRIVAIDYPDLALLGLLDAPSNAVVERVLVHRKVVGTLIHGWQPQLCFQVAVALAAWSLAAESGPPTPAFLGARRLTVACGFVTNAIANGATAGST